MNRQEVIELLEDIAMNSDSAIAKVRACTLLVELKKEEPPENAFDRLDGEHRPLWPVKGKDA